LRSYTEPRTISLERRELDAKIQAKNWEADMTE
jgi:hypothetical protein